MSIVHKVALDAAKDALLTIYRAKRNCGFAVLLFGFIYLFTLAPFSDVNNNLNSISSEIEAATDVISVLENNIENVREARSDTSSAVKEILDEATESMIAQFSELRSYLRDPTRTVESFERDRFADEGTSTSALQMQVQLPEELEQTQTQREELVQTQLLTEELVEILSAVALAEPGHMERLRNWVREHIVFASYAHAQDDWVQNVLPGYLRKFTNTRSNALAAAVAVAEFDPESAAHLNKVSETLANKEEELSTLSLLPEEKGSLPVGEEFWETIPGKYSESDSIHKDVDLRLAAIQKLTDSLDDTLTAATELQLTLQATLTARLTELNAQYAEQKKRLSGVLGFVDVVPLDLKEFGYYFPLILVGSVGFFVHRAGSAREDLAECLSFLDADDPEIDRLRAWHVRRALGGNARTALFRLLGLAGFILAWAILGAYQIGRGVEPWLLPREILLSLTGLYFLATFGHGLIAIRRLLSNVDASPVAGP